MTVHCRSGLVRRLAHLATDPAPPRAHKPGSVRTEEVVASRSSPSSSLPGELFFGLTRGYPEIGTRERQESRHVSFLVPRLPSSSRSSRLVLLGGGVPAVLAQEEMFVTNGFSNSVTVYRRTATGNTAPKRNLMGGRHRSEQPERRGRRRSEQRADRREPVRRLTPLRSTRGWHRATSRRYGPSPEPPRD